MIYGTEAPYDAGARTIHAWGFYGSNANDYRARNPELTWKVMCDAISRILNRERNTNLDKYRKLVK